jgi:hypothetical protein
MVDRDELSGEVFIGLSHLNAETLAQGAQGIACFD